MNDGTLPRRGRLPGDVRVVIRRRAKLPRTLGAGALFSACYGNVGSSIYYALGVTAAFALGLTPLALILAGGIFVTTALNYAEGTTAMPHAGGSSSFARRAFNEPVGFIVGWIQLLNYTATVSISSYTAISYLAAFGKYVGPFQSLGDPVYHVAATVALIVALIGVNVIGIQESSLINLVLAILDLVTQFVLVVLGVFLLLNLRQVIANVHWGIAPTWGSFLASVSIAMVTYTGIETISNMSEEARNPGRSVPRATYAVIVAVLFVSAFLPTIGMSVFDVHPDGHGGFTTELATTWKNDPVAGIVSAFHPAALAYWAGVWVALLAFTILVIATNAGLIGISRLSYSLASNDLFPSVFSRLHPRFRTPYVSLVVFGIAAGILVLPGQIDLMGSIYSLAATFAFCTAHLAVMRLRYVEPDLYRPFQMPFNLPFGRASIPLLSVIGALAIGAVFTELMAENISNSTFLYLCWLALGVLSFVAYRKYHGEPIWEPLESAPEAGREPVTGREALPKSARVHVGRRPRVDLPAPLPPPEPTARRRTRFLSARLLVERHGRMRAGLLALAALAIAALALALDLSPLDPFGPRLGWSPGVIIVAGFATLLLIRSGTER